MSVKIRCPLCNTSRSVNERALGREMQCPNCGGKIRLPSIDRVQSVRQEKEDTELFQLRLEESLRNLQPVQSKGKQLFTVPGTVASDGELTSSTLSQTHSEAEFQLGRALQLLADSPQDSRQEAEAERRFARQERELAAASVNFTRPKAPEQQEMDMTPMVDVTFLLLIFFMVTASFVVQKSIQRPAERTDEPSMSAVVETDDPDTIYVQVDEFNAYNVVVGGRNTPVGSKQDLIILLSDATSGARGSGTQRPMKLIVDAHENCIHSAVVAALDAGREAQIENFQVRTVEQFD